MQSYEVPAGASLDELLKTLTEMTQADHDLTLIVPAGAASLREVENLSRLRRFITSQGIGFHAVVADRVMLGLFRIMGLEATEAGDSSPMRTMPAAPQGLPSAAPAGPPMMPSSGAIPPGPPMMPSLGAMAPPAPPPVRPPVEAAPVGTDEGLDDIDSMNFDEAEYERTIQAENLTIAPTRHTDDPSDSANSWELSNPDLAPSPAPASAPAGGAGGGILGRLWGAIKSVVDPPPFPDDEPQAATPRATTPLSSQPPPAAARPITADFPMAASAPTIGSDNPPAEGPASLDVTLPDWLQAAPAPVPPPYTPPPPASALDVTMPDWLRAEVPVAPVADAEFAAINLPDWMQTTPVPGSLPASEAGLPSWMQQPAPTASQAESAAVPAAPASSLGDMSTPPSWMQQPGVADTGLDHVSALPSWMQEPTMPPAAGLSGTLPPVPAPPAAGLGGEPSAMPAWMHDPPTGDSAASGVTAMPSWMLGSTDPEVAPPAAAPTVGAMPAAAGLPDWLQGNAAPQAPGLPDWLQGNATPGASTPMAGAAASPPPAEAARVPPPVPPITPPSAPGLDMGALGGPPQSAESIAAAVAASHLDARTRSLLLFGMALVRLAGNDARGAALAARQAGCSSEDLRLVVEMAQALGGGPSERMGRRIVEGL